MSNKLFSPFTLGPTPLKNRVVMAPMTRSRAEAGVPTDLMATYYGQRASAGALQPLPPRKVLGHGSSPLDMNGIGVSRSAPSCRRRPPARCR